MLREHFQDRHDVSRELALPLRIVCVYMQIVPLVIVTVAEVPQSSEPDANASCTPVPSIAQLSVLDIIISSFARTDIDDDDLRRTTDVHRIYVSTHMIANTSEMRAASL
jgi:hypothetical protein